MLYIIFFIIKKCLNLFKRSSKSTSINKVSSERLDNLLRIPHIPPDFRIRQINLSLRSGLELELRAASINLSNISFVSPPTFNVSKYLISSAVATKSDSFLYTN